jgi:RNA polymerase sigma factor (sigma-70 family)
MTQDDSTLLDEFVRNDSESAFAAIVQLHIDLVYSAAFRQVNGDSGLASDITQTVFIDLARKARFLAKDTVLPAWLHRATRLTALSALRAAQRRIGREREAVRMQEIEHPPEVPNWNSISVLIDEALDKLNDNDREAVLLRFFQRQTFRDMGVLLRMSEDAARMRVERVVVR